MKTFAKQRKELSARLVEHNTELMEGVGLFLKLHGPQLKSVIIEKFKGSHSAVTSLLATELFETSGGKVTLSSDGFAYFNRNKT